MPDRLPIEPLRPAFEEALAAGPVVVSSPTGSGKSTRVPTWCPAPVLVVEPRRVACRSLAQRVAELEGATLGRQVGYWVRDEKRVTEGTRITFATPGIALRIFDQVERYGTVVVDEFHERTLEVDLLLALLASRHVESGGRLVVMSATLDGDRVAAHLGGRHLTAKGRQFPVEVEYLAGKTLLPEVAGLDARVSAALAARADRPGDVLVFLPGKGEIESVARELERVDADVLPLHGGLSLPQQSRVFEPSRRKKVVLATNVAETSLTVPGVGGVIDSGLVRRTRYRDGRGFLTLVPVATDSADQRTGRAGRTAPGWCVRLWSERAQLEPATPPEMYREALAPLLLAAASLGAEVRELPWLDPPKEHAVETAREELQALGALDPAARITERGRRLFGLPLDAALGALLVAAETAEPKSPGVLRDMVDLVSVLAPGRRLFLPTEPDPSEPPTPETACDAVAILVAARGGRPPHHRLDPGTLAEARSVRQRLEEVFDLAPPSTSDASIDRARLAATILAADRRRGHVARRRGRRTAWSAGGTEIGLARESGVRRLDDVEAIVVLDTMALGGGALDARVLATAAMPVPSSWLAVAGLGRLQIGEVTVEKEAGRPVRLSSVVQRVHAGRVIEEREDVPEGSLAREAIAQLVRDGRLFPEVRREAEARLERAALAAALGQQGGRWLDARTQADALWPEGVPSLEGWLLRRVCELGVESGEDLALLEAGDLLPPDLPEHLRSQLDKTFPRRLDLPDATYEVEVRPGRRWVILEKVRGSRRVPPPVSFLPRFEGFAIKIRHKGTLVTLRDERGRVVGTSVT